MKLFDSHCHIDDNSYKEDFNDVLIRAKNAGVEAMMIAGITEKCSKKAVTIAENHPNIYASVGVHPHDARECNEKTLDILVSLSKSKKVKAWGETGLDFNRMHSSKEDQEKCFIRQLEIAGELNLPLIFHERDSNGRFLELLNTHCKNGQKAVIHCFSGNNQELEQYLELGFYIGITGILTIKSRGKELRKQAQMIPQNRLLVETDAPYLTPAPQKNQVRRNEPAFVKSTLIKLAEVRKEDTEQLAGVVWENTCRLFSIDEKLS